MSSLLISRNYRAFESIKIVKDTLRHVLTGDRENILQLEGYVHGDRCPGGSNTITVRAHIMTSNAMIDLVEIPPIIHSQRELTPSCKVTHDDGTIEINPVDAVVYNGSSFQLNIPNGAHIFIGTFSLNFDISTIPGKIISVSLSIQQ